MSGGTWNHANDRLGQDIFGWHISFQECIGSQAYHDELMKVIKSNVLEDVELTVLVFDVICLLHTYDYTFAGDYSDETLKKEVEVFKKKWLKRTRKDQIKEMIDLFTEKMKKDLYESFCPNTDLCDIGEDSK